MTQDPLAPVLKLALSTAKAQYDFFVKTAEEAQIPEVSALLKTLAESESDTVARLHHMMITGIVDELEELSSAPDRNVVPDATPFDPVRAETDPRLFVCNKVLDRAIKTYTVYLQMATKAKSEVVSQLFEYLAFMKMRQIQRLRILCHSF